MSINSILLLYTSLKNSILLKKKFNFVRYSKLNFLILKKLINLGYILQLSIITKKRCLYLRYTLLLNSHSVLPLQGVKLLISSNSCCSSFTVKQIKRLDRSSLVCLFSTKCGILTKDEVLSLKKGGIPLLSVW